MLNLVAFFKNMSIFRRFAASKAAFCVFLRFLIRRHLRILFAEFTAGGGGIRKRGAGATVSVSISGNCYAAAAAANDFIVG